MAFLSRTTEKTSYERVKLLTSQIALNSAHFKQIRAGSKEKVDKSFIRFVVEFGAKSAGALDLCLPFDKVQA